MNKVKVCYLPNAHDLDHPADRRRFAAYAKMENIEFEIFNYTNACDILVSSQQLDITRLSQIRKKCKVIIYDAIDSYHNDQFSIKGRFRGLAKYVSGQHKGCILNYSKYLKNYFYPCVDIITCASIEQKHELEKFNLNVFSIPDSLEASPKYKQNYDIKGSVNLVWEGLGSNQFQLWLLYKPLKNLSKKYDITLNVITDISHKKFLNRYLDVDSKRTLRGLHDKINIIPWKKRDFMEKITDSDIALIPLDLTKKLSHGKPENKLVHLWKMGMPVLASGSKSYSRVMAHAEVDGICVSFNDWENKIENLILNASLRHENAIKGQAFALELYSEKAFQDKWKSVFHLANKKLHSLQSNHLR
ncbi:hypothetical protein N9H97_03745 [Gammaproteobacteria bacterium]|nr:hypothetical protein [Gammaproteobacteria bacterium]